jgi:hypothetical protein
MKFLRAQRHRLAATLLGSLLAATAVEAQVRKLKVAEAAL